eukprot:scaffold46472_cov36-Prasinocladus_malaysianus.AAC.1
MPFLPGCFAITPGNDTPPCVPVWLPLSIVDSGTGRTAAAGQHATVHSIRYAPLVRIILAIVPTVQGFQYSYSYEYP